VSKKGDIDDILLEVELRPGCEDPKEEILNHLKDHLRARINLGFNVNVHPFGSRLRYEVRAYRFKDLRKLTRERGIERNERDRNA
jgi:phenylacetate-CoA ligase